MDIDDTRPVKKPEIVIGESLDLLSLAELEQRITILESEIVRIRDTHRPQKRGKGRCRRDFSPLTTIFGLSGGNVNHLVRDSVVFSLL